MPQWRNKLMELIRQSGRNPDTREFESVRSADEPMMLWHELFYLFDDAHEQEPPDRAFIAAVYHYALWSVREAPRGDDAGQDPLTSAIVSFFERLPISSARPLMHEFIPQPAFESLVEFFKYFLDDDEYGKFCSEMRERYRRQKDSKRRA